jgi:hypothetical protein
LCVIVHIESDEGWKVEFVASMSLYSFTWD